MEIVNSPKHSPGSAEVSDKARKRKSSNRLIASDDDEDDDNYVGVKSKSDEVEVEENLSDSHSQRPSPPQEPIYNQEEEGTPTSPIRAQSPAYIRQDTTKESTPTASRPQYDMDSPLNVLASSSPIHDQSSKKRARPSSSSSSAATESHATTSRSTSRPKKRMKTASVSNHEWEELNDFQSQQVMDSGMVQGHNKNEKGISEKSPELDSAGMNLNYPLEEEFHRSSSESASDSGSHSLSERGTKSSSPSISRSQEVGSPAPSATSSTTTVIPTPSRRGSDANHEEHDHGSPILSPRAKKRLEIFDKVMMDIESRKEKEKEQRLEDGIIFDNVRKSRERAVGEGEDEEMVVARGGRQEHGFVRTSKEKSWKGKDKEQMKEDKARKSTPKTPEIKKRAESSDVSDSQDKPAFRPENSIGTGGSQGVEADLAVESNNIDMDTQTDTGIVEQQLDPIHLRQEEEESTQDLLAELLYQQQQGVGVGQSGVLPAIQIDSQPTSEAMLEMGVQNRGAGNNEKSDRFLDEIPSVCIIFVSYQNSVLLMPISRLMSRTQAGPHQLVRTRLWKMETSRGVGRLDQEYSSLDHDRILCLVSKIKTRSLTSRL